MKATRYYKDSGQQFTRIQITMPVDSHIIVLALCEIMQYGNPKITKTRVEKEIREVLESRGNINPWYVNLDDEFGSGLRIQAEKKAREMYPDFFTNYLTGETIDSRY